MMWPCAVRSGELKWLATISLSYTYWTYRPDLNYAVETLLLSVRLRPAWQPCELNSPPRSGFHSHTERDGPHANFKVQCMYGPVAKTICLGAILLCQCSEWLWQEIALRITKQAKHIFRLLPAHLDLEVQLRGQDSSVLTQSSNSPWGRVRASKASENDSSAAERLLSSHLEGNCYLLCAYRISCIQALHVGRLHNECDCFTSALYVSIFTHPFLDVLLVLHACCWKTWFQR